MTVEDPESGGRLTLHSEEELTEHFRSLYGEMFTTIKPMPFAEQPFAEQPFAEPPMEEANG